MLTLGGKETEVEFNRKRPEFRFRTGPSVISRHKGRLGEGVTGRHGETRSIIIGILIC